MWPVFFLFSCLIVVNKLKRYENLPYMQGAEQSCRIIVKYKVKNYLASKIFIRNDLLQYKIMVLDQVWGQLQKKNHQEIVTDIVKESINKFFLLPC